MFKRLINYIKNKSYRSDSRSSLDIFIDENGHVENDVPLDNSEKNMLENLLSFRELRVGEVMIPRTDLIGIENEEVFEEIKKRFIETGYTRMPVYRGNLDDIIGFIHIKDVMPYMDGQKPFKIQDIMRKIIYSPRSTKCVDLLSHMRGETTHIAVVLDEYGGTEGMVLIENLVEKIVGDIPDEHDKDKKIFIKQIDVNSFSIDARASIQDVEDKIGIGISNEDGEYETFGGFILSYLDRVPTKGEKIYHDSGIEIEILDAEPRKIKNTLVRIINKVAQ